MRTYQIIFKGGLTRNMEADGFHRTKRYLVFYWNGRVIFHLDADSVMRVEEVSEFAAAAPQEFPLAAVPGETRAAPAPVLPPPTAVAVVIPAQANRCAATWIRLSQALGP